MELPKRYDPKVSEPKWQKFWEENKIFAFDPESTKEVFSIDTPPPTVSGAMHIGHAFSYSQTDFVARFKRMQGFNLFFPFGTDDNGLATERLIERTKKVRSKKMDRQDFIKLCLDTLEEIRPGFVEDWKKLGYSADFDLFYSTINEHCRRISQRSFVELYKADKIYRKHAPIIFCPQCKTAIAQVEMEDQKRSSSLVYVKAQMEGGSYIVYATTRPELIAGCVGMSIHEAGEYVKVAVGDEHWIVAESSIERLGEKISFGEVKGKFRGVDLVGKKVTLPLTGKEVVITHDEITSTDYGTGIVYYCTYGGMDCIEWMTRHPAVKPIHIMGLEGRYNGLCGKYEGMDSPTARKESINDLELAHALVLNDPIDHMVNTHERCGTDIEYVALEQWFIRVMELQEDLLARGKEMQWHPKHMKTRYDNWTNALKWDWCISRQRHYGVPFPLWYCKKCDSPIVAAVKDLPVDPLSDQPSSACSCGSKEFVPEKDVLDTWATSSLTPELAAELVKDKPIFKKLLPMNLRPQAHDIISFWLFNTVVKSHLHHDRVPWQDIAISGFALDARGKKMSKSKGNVIHPQEMISKYSADALRFWAAGSKLGDDMPFQEKDLVTGKKTVTKLWNACKFANMHLEDYKPGEAPALEAFDAYMLSEMNRIIVECTSHFEKYEYSKTKLEADIFFWKMICDNYLEIVKDRMYNPEQRGASGRLSAQFTLYKLMLNTIKMFAPIMPFITEELYQLFFKKHEKVESIHLSSWPSAGKVDKSLSLLGETVLYAVDVSRKEKALKQVSLKTPIKKFLVKGKLPKNEFKRVFADIKSATFTEELSYEQLPVDGKIDFEHSIELGEAPPKK